MRAIAFSRISCLTGRDTHPLSRNSPRVPGRLIFSAPAATPRAARATLTSSKIRARTMDHGVRSCDSRYPARIRPPPGRRGSFPSMTKVAEPAPPAPPAAQPTRTHEPPFLVTFYRSAIAKKWLMAITGIMLLGFVFAHMIGNLKLFLGESHLNAYAEWLRDFGEPAFPRSFLLWCLRVGLIVAFVVHIVAAYQLT